MGKRITLKQFQREIPNKLKLTIKQLLKDGQIVDAYQLASDYTVIQLDGVEYDLCKYHHGNFVQAVMKVGQVGGGVGLDLGFKDRPTALRSLQVVEELPINQADKFTKVERLFYQAKNHPHQTSEMKEAMGIYQNWLRKNYD